MKRSRDNEAQPRQQKYLFHHSDCRDQAFWPDHLACPYSPPSAALTSCGMGRLSRSFLHALGSHPSYFLRSLHCAFAHSFALFSNDLRLPADELALNLEQVLRTPGLND